MLRYILESTLKQKYYLRYCDDFIILDPSQEKLVSLLPLIKEFLFIRLGLILHPNKIILRKTNQGVDFLGYVVMPYRRIMRAATRRRLLRKLELKADQLESEIITENYFEATWQSYLGMLAHCHGHKILQEMLRLLRPTPPRH